MFVTLTAKANKIFLSW